MILSRFLNQMTIKEIEASYYLFQWATFIWFCFIQNLSFFLANIFKFFFTGFDSPLSQLWEWKEKKSILHSNNLSISMFAGAVSIGEKAKMPLIQKLGWDVLGYMHKHMFGRERESWHTRRWEDSGSHPKRKEKARAVPTLLDQEGNGSEAVSRQEVCSA